MPLELGIFLGAKRYGSSEQKRKRLIVLDCEKYRYQQAISDISGQDIECHNGEPKATITCVRNWLGTVSRRQTIPGARYIVNRYVRYEADLPAICDALKYDAVEYRGGLGELAGSKVDGDAGRGGLTFEQCAMFENGGGDKIDEGAYSGRAAQVGA